MKRKLNEDSVPTPVEPVANSSQDIAFTSLGLDSRLLQAIAQENFTSPTEVQAKAIPRILEGKDLLGWSAALFNGLHSHTSAARAKTGSGKTAAYLLPILESILRRKIVCEKVQGGRSCKGLYNQ